MAGDTERARKIHRWLSRGVETVLVFILAACVSVWLIGTEAHQVDEYRKAIESFAPMELATTYRDAFDIDQFACLGKFWQASKSCPSTLDSKRSKSVTVTDKPRVDYFREEDEAGAADIAGIANSLIPDSSAKLELRRSNVSNPPGFIGLWLPAN